jgi:CO dehydrogenase/acetyl-CoA synthase gamma subunit (corrinoid Fe-S protein)
MLMGAAMSEADLYLNTIDLCRYWPANVEMPCRDFLTRLAAGKGDIEDCTFLTPEQVQAFRLVLEAKTYLPSVPQLTVPQPIEKGLLPINEPGEDSLVIVTGNNQSTFEVLATIWAQDITPAYFLLVDCLGSTVDMAVIYGDFTPARLAQVMVESGLESRVKHRHMIVPGLTASIAADFAKATNWEIEVGPVCAVELPLFLGDRWLFSTT